MERTGRIKEELLSASGLLHTLAANANGKRTHTLTASIQPIVPAFELWKETGEPGDTPHVPRTFLLPWEGSPAHRIHQMESQKFKFKILYVYKGELLDWECLGMQSWKTLLRTGGAKLTRTFKEENFLLSTSPSSPGCHGDQTGRSAMVRIESFKLSLHILSRTL